MWQQLSVVRVMVWGGVLLAVIMIASLVFPVASKRVQMAMWGVVSPAVQAITEPITVLGGVIATVRDTGVMRNTIEELQQENITLRASVASLTHYQHKNTQLRQQLELVAQSPIDEYQRVAADVIGFNLGQQKKWMMINRGERDGMVVGRAVIANERVLIGTIVDVGTNTSRVQLLTSTASTVRVATATHGTMGIVRGVADLGMRLTYVNRAQPLTDGDDLVSVQSPTIPAQLVVGSVREIVASADGLFHESVVMSLFDIRDMHTIYVLIPFTSTQ